MPPHLVGIPTAFYHNLAPPEPAQDEGRRVKLMARLVRSSMEVEELGLSDGVAGPDRYLEEMLQPLVTSEQDICYKGSLPSIVFGSHYQGKQLSS